MRHFAITGIDTASWMPLTISGSDMRATPPSRRMSAGTRSSAMTATAPDASAIFACSASTTSMITPPLSISARPVFTRIVPYSAMPPSVAGLLRVEAAERVAQLGVLRRLRPDEDGVALGAHHVAEVALVDALREPPEGLLRAADAARVLREGDGHDVAALRGRLETAVAGERGDQPDLVLGGRDVLEALRAQAGERALRRVDRAAVGVAAAARAAAVGVRAGRAAPGRDDGEDRERQESRERARHRGRL